MNSLFPIFVLILAGALAFGSGCAEDDGFPGAGGGGRKDTTNPGGNPTPSTAPSGTGGVAIND